MAREFVADEGGEQHLLLLLDHVDGLHKVHTNLSCCVEFFAAELLAAFKEPECGAEVWHQFLPGAGSPVVLQRGNRGRIGFVCREPRGHDGPHLPHVPAECWRMPDGR